MNLLLCFSNERVINAKRFSVLVDAEKEMNEQIAKHIGCSDINALNDGNIIKDDKGHPILQFLKDSNRVTIHYLESNLYINWSIMDLSKVDYENDIELLDDICS